MSAVFVQPLPFTSSSAAVVGSANNLAIDMPALVWRGATTSTLVIDLGTNASYDTVALVGTNLRSQDVVRVQAGDFAVEVQAFTGTKPPLATSKTIVQFATRTDRYLRIDITATGHPDNYVEVQRVVVGTAIKTLGLGFDFEHQFEDSSVRESGPGWEVVDEYDVVVAAKFSTSGISDAKYRAEWFPLLQWAGNRRAILMIPDDSSPEDFQTDVVFGRITSKASGKVASYNNWRIEGIIKGLAV